MKKYYIIGVAILIIAIVIEIAFLSLHAFAIVDYGMFTHLPSVLLFFVSVYFLDKYKKS